MVRRKPRRKPLGTIWEISDELWRRIEPILLEFWPKKPTGRKVANWRKMLNAIIFRMRSGCQWDQLPERYGPKSTVHDWFQRWAAAGIFERIWAVLVAECDQQFPLNLSCEKKTICNTLFGNWLWQQPRSSYCTLSMLLVL